MNARPLLLAGLAAMALLPVAAGAAPPAAGSAPAAPPSIVHGPPIPGLCVVSTNVVIGNSKVGLAVLARLKVLATQVNAELQPEADGIQTDGKALQNSQASLDAATLQAKRVSLEQRVQAFEKREQQRQQEMQATQQKQFGVISKELNPIMVSLYEQSHCSVLLDADGGGVRIANPAMDLSAKAVAGLDARIQTLTFDREHQDGQPGAPAR